MERASLLYELVCEETLPDVSPPDNPIFEWNFPDRTPVCEPPTMVIESEFMSEYEANLVDGNCVECNWDFEHFGAVMSTDILSLLAGDPGTELICYD